MGTLLGGSDALVPVGLSLFLEELQWSIMEIEVSWVVEGSDFQDGQCVRVSQPLIQSAWAPSRDLAKSAGISEDSGTY